MKRFLVLALAAFAFAACSEKEETGNQPAQNAELEQSYVAVTFTADGITRADDGKYEVGRDEERAVKFAHIFFFQNGKAFHVQFDNTTTTHAGPNNYIKIALEGSTEDMDKVSDIKDKVLVIQNYKGEYPNQIVAVLNWNPTKSDYTLSELQTEIVGLGNDEQGYIMSNAVYADKANTVVDAVSLTEANIGKSADEALANPVTIYVERVAAKVEYSAKDNGKFDTGKEINGVKIYAQIENFELFNDYEESRLLKKINPNWATEDANFGFTNWNDVDWFRSYWATSLDKAFPNNAFDWNNDNTKLNKWNYLGENTRSGEENRTKVIIKAKLVNEAGNPVEVVNWYGKDYVGEDELKIVVANTLKYTYFTSNDDGNTFIGITPEDIKCVARDPEMENAFEVYFQLDDSVMEKRWYKFDSKESSYVLYSSNEELNKELKMTVQPALVYNDGMTYYWLDIKHLGKEGSTTEYGIVRNHVYKVNITGIKGYGTPIYDPNEDFITPDKPEDIVTFVSADVRILSWRVVANDYEI